MAALFDSRDTAYRDPFGAVTAGTPVHLRLRVPRNVGCHAAFLCSQEADRAPEWHGMFWAGMAGENEEWWECHFVPDHPAIYHYHFELETAAGRRRLCRLPGGTAAMREMWEEPAAWQLTCYAADFVTPAWLQGGVMYQIFPDRFAASGDAKQGVPDDRVQHDAWGETPVWRPDAWGKSRNNDFFGGDLRGIEQKLDYLRSLGVTCLYLNPIFEAHSNHRYDTADYRRVDPMLGDEKDLRSLCMAAKKRGIRVLLDGVFSHTGSDSRYFNKEHRYPGEGAYNSPASPYSRWYRFRRWPDDYAGWWGFDTLPEVDECDPSFLDFITGDDGVVPYWLKQGAGGWRLDVADELPDTFLDALRAAVKRTDPDALVLGEVWEDASNKYSYGHLRRYLLGDQLDSVMNYPFRDAVLGFVGGGDAGEFVDRVMTVTEHYPAPVLHLLMNHIGTHDTERALTVLGGEPAGGRGREWQAAQRLTPEQRAQGIRRLKLASLLQYCLPGVPCVYYGDEAGMEGYRDPFNRGCYPWGQEDAALVDWYRQLGRMRREAAAALKAGTFEPLASAGGAVVFVRRGADGALLCAVNRSETEAVLPLPTDWRGAVPLIGEGVQRSGMLYLPGMSGTVLCRRVEP